MGNYTPKPDIDVNRLPLVESEPMTFAESQVIAQLGAEDMRSQEKLSDAGKRLVEWGTAATTLFFAALALLQNPNMLAAFQFGDIRFISGIAVVCYLAAIILGFIASVPLRYVRRQHHIREAQRVHETALRRKYRLVMAGSLMFTLGTLALGFAILLILGRL